MWRRDVTSQNFEGLKKEIVMSLSHFKHILVINIIYLLIHYGMVSSPPKYRISLLQLKNFWFSMSEGKNLRVTMWALILCNKNQNKMIQLDFRQVGYYLAECCTMGWGPFINKTLFEILSPLLNDECVVQQQVRNS